MTSSTSPGAGAEDLLRALRRRWRELTDELGVAPTAAESLGEDLLARYREPHRHHHDLTHLAEVLAALEELAAPEGPGVDTRLAAWFHDAVYQGAPDDEERSAELAHRALLDVGAPDAVAATTAEMVRATAGHLRPDDTGPDDPATAQLLDADLWVLAAPEDRYDRYADGVRREHADVDEATFAAGRSRALHTLLDRPHLFHTEEGRRRFDAPARRNLRRELAALSPTGG